MRVKPLGLSTWITFVSHDWLFLVSPGVCEGFHSVRGGIMGIASSCGNDLLAGEFFSFCQIVLAANFPHLTFF